MQFVIEGAGDGGRLEVVHMVDRVQYMGIGGSIALLLSVLYAAA